MIRRPFMSPGVGGTATSTLTPQIKIPTPDEVDFVISHGNNCPDGLAAAWAVWERLGDRAQYYFTDYNLAPPDVAGKNVAMVDFSFKRPDLLQMMASARSMVILDHHDSAQRELAGIPNAIFDMKKSGAILAWEFFHPGEPLPALLLNIDDRDRWQWKLEGSREVHEMVLDRGFTVEAFDELAQMDIHDVIAQGKPLCRKTQKTFELMTNNPFTFTTNSGLKVYIINGPQVFRSELGETLYTRYPDCDIAIVYEELMDQRLIKLSLRTNRPHIRVNDIAKNFSGAGHPGAAGARWTGNIYDFIEKFKQEA